MPQSLHQDRQTGCRAALAAAPATSAALQVCAALQPVGPLLVAAALLAATAFFFPGCSTDFAQEMEIKPGEKTRPLGVVCEPAEAVPGETVTVTSRFYDPDPPATSTSWKLALDYRLDRYDELEYEGMLVDLEPLMQDRRTAVDENGIVTESFAFTVPDSCLLVSSAIPAVITADLPPHIAELMQPAGHHPTKQEANTFLAAVDTTTLTPDQLAWLQSYSDFFACQIRLRCAVRGNTPLDVTRNLTVRYSRRLGSPNENLNPLITAIALIDVHAADVGDKHDIACHASDTTFVYHSDPTIPVERTIEVRSGHTYFLEARSPKQAYVSPAGIRHDEDNECFWYYTRYHGARDDLFFIKQHNGDENTDMGPLDEIVRIEPPPAGLGPQRYQLHLVVRDVRPEWRMFQGTPGTAYAGLELLFAPATR